MRNRLIVSSHRVKTAYARRRARGVRHPQTTIQPQAVTRHSQAAQHSRDHGCLKAAGRNTTYEEHLTVVPVSEWRPDPAPVHGVSADVYAGLAATTRRPR
jgi:hypothetical protein